MHNPLKAVGGEQCTSILRILDPRYHLHPSHTQAHIQSTFHVLGQLHLGSEAAVSESSLFAQRTRAYQNLDSNLANVGCEGGLPDARYPITYRSTEPERATEAVFRTDLQLQHC